jgi:predicted PurR-regulated permease PerM
MNKYLTRKNILILISALVVFVILYYFRNLVAYILISAVLSLILQPIVGALSSIRLGKVYFPKSFAAAIAIVAFWLFVFVVLRLLIPLIYHEAMLISTIQTSSVVTDFQREFLVFMQSFQSFDIPIESSSDIAASVLQKLLEIFNLSDFSSVLSNLTNTISTLAVGIFVVTFVTFFFLKDQTLFTTSVLLMVPNDLEDEVKRIMLSIRRLLIRYFVGILFDMILVFGLITFGMVMIGLDMRHAATLALVGAILNVIPYAGPILSLSFGLTLGTVIHFTGPIYDAYSTMIIWMAVIYLSVNVLDAALIQPFIFSKSVKAHPLEVFLVILVAGTVAGIPGMIFAIPSYTIFRVIAREFLSGFKIIRKLTEKI